MAKKTRRIAVCMAALLSAMSVPALAASSAPSSGNASMAQANEWRQIKFTPLSGSRSEKVVSTLYAGFLRRHPDASIQVAEVNLNDGHTVSLAVRFFSSATCRDNSSCTTNVLWYDGRAWREVWSRHVSRLMIGPVSPPYLVGPRSPTNNADGMRELKGDDGLIWRWLGAGRYYPVLGSIAEVWPRSKPASTVVSDFAKSLHPGYIVAPRDYVAAIPVDFGLMSGYIAVYHSGNQCGQIGCPFVVITGTPGHFQANGEGIFDEIGGTIPDKRWNAFAVQRDNHILDFYRYEGGRYILYASTSPTPHLPAP